MIRRFGEAIVRDAHYKMRPGAYGVLALGRDLLLTHQSKPEPEYQLPGGGIDAGESPIAALHREVMEETGWRISGARKLGVFRRFTYMPEYGFFAEKLCHIYLARPVRRHSPPTEAHHLAVWMDAGEALLQLAGAGDQHFVQQIINRIRR